MQTAEIRGLRATWAAVRDRLAVRRAERDARAQLERELSAYRTPAERRELDAIIALHAPEDTADLRRVLDRLRVT